MPFEIAQTFNPTKNPAPALEPVAVEVVAAEPAVPPVQETRPTARKPMPAKPVPATAPARELRKTPEENKNQLMKFLSAFVEGGSIDPKKTLFKLVSVAKSGVQLMREEWDILFGALSRADEISLENRMFHIIDGKCDPTKFFMLAPPDMLLAYLFSKEGLVVKIKTFFSEMKDGQEIERYLLAKVGLLLDLVWVAKKTAKLTEKEEEILSWIVPTLQKRAAPEGLVNDAMGMMNSQRVCEKKKGKGQLGLALDHAVAEEKESGELSKLDPEARQAAERAAGSPDEVANRPFAALNGMVN